MKNKARATAAAAVAAVAARSSERKLFQNKIKVC